MNRSPADWETLFNVFYFGCALVISLFVVVGYKSKPPKYYGLLYWALTLILGASFLFGLYNGSLEAFLEIRGLKAEEAAVRTRLTDNLRTLVFVVPGVMLAIAANLITQFMNTQAPSERPNRYPVDHHE